jgi:peptidoglycan hydrolase-like protein with peptidoglycan-binding domain
MTRAVALAVLVGACGTSSPAGRPDERPQPIGVAPPGERFSPEESRLVLAPAPQALFEAAGVRAVQSALAAQGLETPATGRYDTGTQASMLEFQRREGLAATGMPDLLSLERLGLDAKELYRTQP